MFSNTLQNKQDPSSYNYNFTDLKDYLYYYSNIFHNELSNKSFFTYIGPIRIRFFKLIIKNPCPQEYNTNPLGQETPNNVFFV